MYYSIYSIKFYSRYMFMNEASAGIVIIALFLRRNTKMKKMQVRSSYMEVFCKITVLDIC